MPPEIHHTEQYLLSRLQQGDTEAFTQLYHLYSERLYLNILKLVKNEATAEEILQDIFIAIWEKRKTIDIQSSFRSYLFKAGENRVYDFFRKLKRDKKLHAKLLEAIAEPYTHIEEAMLRQENRALLQQALEILPPQRKQVFELCKIQGKSYQEVSGILGISTATVNDHIVKAMKSIKEFMQSHKEMFLLLLIIGL